MEIGTLGEFTEHQSEFLDIVNEKIAVAIESAQSRTELGQSLDRSRKLSGELQAQQEELRVSNEELEEQVQKRSEEKVKTGIENNKGGL